MSPYRRHAVAVARSPSARLPSHVATAAELSLRLRTESGGSYSSFKARSQFSSVFDVLVRWPRGPPCCCIMYAAAYFSRTRQNAAKLKSRSSLRYLGYAVIALCAAAVIVYFAPAKGLETLRRRLVVGRPGMQPMQGSAIEPRRTTSSPDSPATDPVFYAIGDLPPSPSAAETPTPVETPSATPALTPTGTPFPAAAAAPAGPSVFVKLPTYAHTLPARPSAWVAEQRPLADGSERTLTSHTFEEIRVASMNPPPALDSLTGACRAELESRLIVAIALGVHSGGSPFTLEQMNFDALPLFNTMFASWLSTMQPHHTYRVYLAFDHTDHVYENAANRDAITKELLARVAAEDAKRWHPPGYAPLTTCDNTALIMSVHWVHCNFNGKPAWAHSDAVMAAYKEGADYAFRPNDDTKLPERGDWVDAFIDDLRQRRPIPNLGVVGPDCKEGATWILTHDFTHRTHAVIFGYQYPRSLPDWSSDDWITKVYSQFNVPNAPEPLMKKRLDVPVVHTLHQMRYVHGQMHDRLPALNSELKSGAAVVAAYAKEKSGVDFPYKIEHVSCC